MSEIRSQDGYWRDVDDGESLGQLESLPTFHDARGHLAELFRDDAIPEAMLRGRCGRPQMGYVSVTEQGIVRGPHEHVRQTDMFIFCESSFTVFLWDPMSGSRQKLLVPADGYYRLIVPAGVVHAYRAESLRAVSLNFPDALYAGRNKQEPVDEIRHEANPESPYTLW